MFVRKFIEAVLDYTRADKIYVVGHSMGVTLARKAI
jgi:triacylglycerol esterase/lipase EstA (alpha/beta hydrolase family)